MRGSGAGGQHRNHGLAVRARHLPTGIEVRCESRASIGTGSWRCGYSRRGSPIERARRDGARADDVAGR